MKGKRKRKMVQGGKGEGLKKQATRAREKSLSEFHFSQHE